MTIKNLVPRLVGRGREHGLARREDYDPLLDFQRDMNRLFDDFFTDFGLVPRHAQTSGVPAMFNPRVDVAETEKEVAISAELPGLDEKDIVVEMDDESVTIRGERKEEKEEKGKNWFRREQSYGSFHRVITLPASVEGGKAKAVFKKGVLKVTAPKKEGSHEKSRIVNIES